MSSIINVQRVQEKQKYELAQIIATNKTPVQSDMVSKTTIDAAGKKRIPMKSTGHEKSRVLVCLAVKADGARLKPMVVFRGAVRECKVLCQEFRTQAVIARSPKGWMNTELTLQQVIGAFPSKRRLLAWDSHECYIEDAIKMSLTTKKIDTVIVLGGYTKYVQAPDVLQNKTFKANCTEKYDDWLVTKKIDNERKAGNLNLPPRKEVLKWLLNAWAALPSEMTKDSFIHCALILPNDGSRDDLVHCFKKGEPCFQGSEVLRSQLMILQDEENPFENPSESDVEEAYKSCQLLDQDEEDDENFDIL